MLVLVLILIQRLTPNQKMGKKIESIGNQTKRMKKKLGTLNKSLNQSRHLFANRIRLPRHQMNLEGIDIFALLRNCNTDGISYKSKS